MVFVKNKLIDIDRKGRVGERDSTLIMKGFPNLYNLPTVVNCYDDFFAQSQESSPIDILW